jgi:hypothetical protein
MRYLGTKWRGSLHRVVGEVNSWIPNIIGKTLVRQMAKPVSVLLPQNLNMQHSEWW